MDVLARLPGARPCGSNTAMVRCPFHRREDGSRERCASMKVNFETRRFFCFSCLAGGDLDELSDRFR